MGKDKEAAQLKLCFIVEKEAAFFFINNFVLNKLCETSVFRRVEIFLSGSGNVSFDKAEKRGCKNDAELYFELEPFCSKCFDNQCVCLYICKLRHLYSRK